MTEIYFVRHAESFGNLARRAYGWYDGFITPKGYEQIRCLEERFRDISIDAVYSSDLLRASETAGAIYKQKNLPLHKEKGFREVGLGVWEDVPWGELPVRFPKEYVAWEKNPLEFDLAGAETYRGVYQRARKALDRIVSENEGKTIAIVSHGAVLRMLMYGVMNGGKLEGVENAEWGDNTSVSRFRVENGMYTEVLKNDNTHLEKMPNFADNMSWTKGKGQKNLCYEEAELPRDKEKLRGYYSKAWLTVFGEELKDIKGADFRAKRILRRNGQNLVFAVCSDGEVGAIELDEETVLYPETGHVSLLFLNPEFRRMGYGIQVIGHAVSRYKSLGKKHISVRVAETNTAAIAFYKKYGFYELFREKEDGVRQIVMLLDI